MEVEEDPVAGTVPPGVPPGGLINAKMSLRFYFGHSRVKECKEVPSEGESEGGERREKWSLLSTFVVSFS